MWILDGQFTTCHRKFVSRRTDDFESKGPGTNTVLITLVVEKMAAMKYVWSKLLLSEGKRQLSEDLVSFQRPLALKYLLLGPRNSVTPVLVRANSRSPLLFEAKTLANDVNSCSSRVFFLRSLSSFSRQPSFHRPSFFPLNCRRQSLR